MNIHEFLGMPHRFRWGGVGGDDCTTFAASWCRELTGCDPAEDLRGTYQDQEAAHEIIHRNGGLVSFVGGRLQALGWRRVQSAADGDIAVIRAPLGIGQGVAEITAIRFGPLWATMAPAGVVARRAESVAIWRASI